MIHLRWWQRQDRIHPGVPHPDAETRDEEIERRLRAIEANLSNIWEHLNGRGPGDR